MPYVDALHGRIATRVALIQKKYRLSSDVFKNHRTHTLIREYLTYENLAQLFKYLLTGIGSAGLETVLFWFLCKEAGIPWVIANTTAIVAAFCLNFHVDRYLSLLPRSSLLALSL
ncbi:MAG: GtrA family protein [Methylococcales bacterium]